MRTLSTLAVGLLLVSISALPVQSAPAAWPQGVERATDLSAQSTSNRKKRKSSRRGYDSRASSGQQIACTQLGCHPIPRGCRVVPGRIPFTWDPSGFDDIVCPHRR